MTTFQPTRLDIYLVVHIALLLTGIRAICSSADAALSEVLHQGRSWTGSWFESLLPSIQGSFRSLFLFVPHISAESMKQFQVKPCFELVCRGLKPRSSEFDLSIRTLKGSSKLCLEHPIFPSHLWPRDWTGPVDVRPFFWESPTGWPPGFGAVSARPGECSKPLLVDDGL